MCWEKIHANICSRCCVVVASCCSSSKSRKHIHRVWADAALLSSLPVLSLFSLHVSFYVCLILFLSVSPSFSMLQFLSYASPCSCNCLLSLSLLPFLSQSPASSCNSSCPTLFVLSQWVLDRPSVILQWKKPCVGSTHPLLNFLNSLSLLSLYLNFYYSGQTWR